MFSSLHSIFNHIQRQTYYFLICCSKKEISQHDKPQNAIVFCLEVVFSNSILVRGCIVVPLAHSYKFYCLNKIITILQRSNTTLKKKAKVCFIDI